MRILNVSNVELSPLEEARFGIRTARAPQVTRAELPSVLHFCRQQGVMLLIARCLVSDLPVAQEMERLGFRLMDTLVYQAYDVASRPIPEDREQVPIRLLRPEDVAHIEPLAATVFRGYDGHYHADPRLDPAQCDAAYVSWAVRSCQSREVADDVLVAELDGRLVGFVTLRLNNPSDGEIVVGGVTPEAQGRGIYRSFIVRGMEWCRSRGARRTLVSTQIQNTAVQRVWARLGFEPTHAYYTFHKWFDAADASYERAT